MFQFLGIGILLGLSAGIAPGPLLMLVISETLRHGTRAGITVALAPIITDLPIIAASLLVLANLAGYGPVLGVVSLFGSLFLCYTGYQTLQVTPVNLALPGSENRSLAKGILTNLLSPHPYLFWITVGTPLVYRTLEQGPLSLAAFLGGFYLCLVGSKVMLAVGVGRSRALLRGRPYLYSMRLLGLLLLLFALLLLRDGISMLRSAA
ncbi:MAG: LysE family translocator [Geobacter sp.]|nr:LysE family translocator [Geobacter sp.]